MADIAFLLLIFFLVATTIDQDQGLLRKLPPDIPAEKSPQKKRNVLMVRVNSNNDVQVNGEVVLIEDLKDLCMAFIDNRGRREDWSEKPEEAIISLKASINTDYNTYIQVQNKLVVAC